MAFDPFRGYTPDQPASIYDVQRRQKLAETLLSNQLSGAAMSSPLSAIANTLAGAASGYENTQAAEEAQAGRAQSNDLLSQALAGNQIDPQALMQAAGGGFMDPAQSDIATALMKKKYQLGETFFGTPIVTVDTQGKLHLFQPGSMGDTREMNFNGNTPAPQQQYLNAGTQYIATPKNAGVVLPTSGTAPGVIPINNAQAEADKAGGTEAGKLAVEAPANLQAEQQGIQQLDNQYQTASSAIKDVLASANNWTTGTLGAVLNSAPGTPQYDLKQKLTTLQAIIGFQTLAAIRNASKTGGGLGQISDFEERLLSAVQGSIDQGQSPEQFMGNLQRIQSTLDELNQQAHQNYKQDFDRLSKAPAAPPILGSNTPNPYVANGSIPAPAPSPASLADPLGIR